LDTTFHLLKVNLGVAAIKSRKSTWDLEVKSSHFNFKSPSKFFEKRRRVCERRSWLQRRKVI